VIIAGIDPSLTRTGLVLYDSKTKRVLLARHIELKRKPGYGFDHLIALGKQVEAILKKHKPDTVVIESPFIFRGRISGATNTFYYHSILRYIIFELNLPLHEFAPKDLKKRFTGNGSASKCNMIYHALYEHKKRFYSNDLADAFALCISFANTLGD
jgi:Holliday junction resolvasome RuvABC endonuclease subunit